MLYFILLLAFSSVVFIILGINNLVFASRIGILNRLDTYTKEEVYENDNVSLREFLLNIINKLGNLLSRKNSMENKRKKLQQAYIFMRVEEFIGISILAGLVFGLLFFVLTKLWILSLIGFALGYKIPDVFVNSSKRNRMKRLNNQLPEALNIISNGLRVGFSFNQAMNVAANELERPIKDEFNKILRDNSIGKTLDEALIAFSNRTDDEDVDMFITALLIQRKVGGNLAEVLDTIANTIRDRTRIRGEVKTLTAQGRLSAIVISVLPFGVAGFIFIANPSYIMELFKSTFGLIMVVLALVLQVLGIFIIVKMSKVEY